MAINPSQLYVLTGEDEKRCKALVRWLNEHLLSLDLSETSYSQSYPQLRKYSPDISDAGIACALQIFREKGMHVVEEPEYVVTFHLPPHRQRMPSKLEPTDGFEPVD